MTLDKDYETEKNKALNGRITRELFPYLFQYYKEVCKNPIITKYEDFSEYFNKYLNAPIASSTGQIEQPIESLYNSLGKIFNVLDKKYTEP